MDRLIPPLRIDLPVAGLALCLLSIGAFTTALDHSVAVTPEDPPTNSCPLLEKLPLEIRLQIYEYVLQDHTYRFKRHARAGRPLYRIDDDDNSDMPSILRVCAQMTNEVVPNFASIVTLKLHGKTSITRFLRFKSIFINKATLKRVAVSATHFNAHIVQRLITELPALKSLRIRRGTFETSDPVAATLIWFMRQNPRGLNLETVWATIMTLLDACKLPMRGIFDLARAVSAIEENRRPKFEVVCNLRITLSVDGTDADGGELTILPVEGMVLYRHWGLVLKTEAAWGPVAPTMPDWKPWAIMTVGDSTWV